MSKNKVWNKGKHNGGMGGPLQGKTNPKGKGNPRAVVKKPLEADVSSGTSNGASIEESRIDRIEKMNRDHWVSRPARVKSELQEDRKQGKHDGPIFGE